MTNKAMDDSGVCTGSPYASLFRFCAARGGNRPASVLCSRAAGPMPANAILDRPLRGGMVDDA